MLIIIVFTNPYKIVYDYLFLLIFRDFCGTEQWHRQVDGRVIIPPCTTRGPCDLIVHVLTTVMHTDFRYCSWWMMHIIFTISAVHVCNKRFCFFQILWFFRNITVVALIDPTRLERVTEGLRVLNLFLFINFNLRD